MRLWALALLLGIAAGFVAGGRLRGFASLPLTLGLGLLAWAALGFQVAAGFVSEGDRAHVIYASHALVAAFLVLLVRRVRTAAGIGIRVAVTVLLVGWLMNLAVMLPNGGMPVSESALARVAIEATEIDSGNLWKHVRITDDTQLALLGDVTPLPGLGIVASAGDFVLAAGFFLLAASAMRRARERPSAASHHGRGGTGPRVRICRGLASRKSSGRFGQSRLRRRRASRA